MSSIICCPFFWWNVNLFCFLCFFLFFRFTFWSNFISYFISNQVFCCFCSLLNYSIRRSFCGIYSCFCCSIHYFFTIFITEFSWKWQKAISFNVFSKFWFCWISNFCNVYPIISVKLRLSSTSSALLARSLNQTSTEENSILTVFIVVEECGEIFIHCPNCLLATKVNNTFDVCW